MEIKTLVTVNYSSVAGRKGLQLQSTNLIMNS